MNNIEKSAFRRGEYVGYGHNTVWHIIKLDKTWRAIPRDYGRPIYAKTLQEVSDALASRSL